MSAGSGVATLAIPGCPGVPADLAEHTISLPFNDLDGVAQAFERFGSEVAAVIIERCYPKGRILDWAEGNHPGKWRTAHL